MSVRLRYPELEAELMGPGVLPAGSVTRFSTPFWLPADSPPTHAIEPAYSRLRLFIHISIPWRIDGRHRYDFAVRLPPPPEVVRTPTALRSTRPGAAPDAPRLELGARLGVPHPRRDAGRHVRAVSPGRSRAARRRALARADALADGHGRIRERRGAAITAKLTLPAGSAGTSVPFRFDLPLTMTPSFACASHVLSWYLIARTGSFFGPKLDVVAPLQIVDATAAVTTAKLTSAPRIGDEQARAALARLAGCRLCIAYSYRDQGGTFLVSRIDHPSLGLGCR